MRLLNIQLVLFRGVAFLNLTKFTHLSAPPGAPGGRISYPNTIPKRIGPIMIHTKFDQNWTKTVGEVVFLVIS